MAPLTPREILDMASGTTVGQAAARVIIAPLLALAGALASGILSFGDLVSNPIRAMADGMSQFILAVLTSPIPILDLSAMATARSFFGPVWGNLGPFAFPLGIASVMLGIVVVGWFRSREITSNIWPGLPFDIRFDWIPGISGQEEEED